MKDGDREITKQIDEQIARQEAKHKAKHIAKRNAKEEGQKAGKKAQKLTDCHVHIIAFPDASNKYSKDNIVSEKLRSSYIWKSSAKYHGWDLSSPDVNSIYIESLSKQLSESKQIKGCVAFGLDGVYLPNGDLDINKSTFVISNDYVYHMTKKHKNIQYAVSINPARKDALDQIDLAIKRRAKLVKFLPNTQGFSPADKKFKKFYQKLADANLPLLGHTGYEFAASVEKQSYGHPLGYRLAMDQGVKFIAAHSCATGLFVFERHKKTILRLFEEYPNFYMDISALSLPTRYNVTRFLKKLPQMRNRLFFGSDYPLPIMAFPSMFRLGPIRIRHIMSEPNYFDRYYELSKALGILPTKDPFKL